MTVTKSFDFESRTIRSTADPETYAELEVDVSIQCRDKDGCDATYDIEWIALKGSDECLELEALSPDDQLFIDRRAQELADEHACEAYQHYIEGASDRAYDEWKDRDL